MPKAYVVNEIEVTDPVLFQTYADQVPAILKKYGGRYLVRSGQVHVIDGPSPGRLVITEFPSVEAAKAWRDSPEYLAVLPTRDASSTSRVYIAEGYVPPV